MMIFMRHGAVTLLNLRTHIENGGEQDTIE